MTHRPSPASRPRMSGARTLVAITALGVAIALPAVAPRAQPVAGRGALLYDTHCIGCHTTQAHWRDRRLVTDWASLREQVRRWQDLQRLGWSEDDVTAVARHLNARFYRLREAGDQGPAAGLHAPRLAARD